MNCSNCGIELITGVKFCPDCGTPQVSTCKSCGSSLKKDARFCGECGCKVEVTSTKDETKFIDSINLTSIQTGLAHCNLKITSISTEGPDSDDEFQNIKVKYEVKNESKIEWDYLTVRLQLLNAEGHVILEATDHHEQTFIPGETEEVHSYFSPVKAKLFATNPEKAHVVISATACMTIKQNLGQVNVPSSAYDVVTLKPIKMGDSLQLLDICLWKGEPGDDKESLVEVKALVQNLTNFSLPVVRLIAEVKNQAGEELTDASVTEEVKQASICTLNGSAWVKDKMLNGATTELSLNTAIPVAIGFTQSQGLNIIASDIHGEDSDEDEENDSDEDMDNDESSESFNCREVVYSTFVYTKNEFATLSLIEESKKWSEALNSDSFAYPLLDGSPYDDDGYEMSVAIDEEPNDNVVYVIPHYFYNHSRFKPEKDIDDSWTISLADVVGQLIPGRPMSGVIDDESNVLNFECEFSKEATEPCIYIFFGSNFIGEYKISNVYEEIKQEVLDSIS